MRVRKKDGHEIAVAALIVNETSDRWPVGLIQPAETARIPAVGIQTITRA